MTRLQVASRGLLPDPTVTAPVFDPTSSFSHIPADSASVRKRKQRHTYKYVSVEGPSVAIEDAHLERDLRPSLAGI
jgi:hypothetical protein